MDYKAKIAKGGRIIIPIQLREKLALEAGDDIILREEPDGSLQLLTYQQQLARVRAQVRASIPQDVSLTDSLRAMRRADAEHEARA